MGVAVFWHVTPCSVMRMLVTTGLHRVTSQKTAVFILPLRERQTFLRTPLYVTSPLHRSCCHTFCPNASHHVPSEHHQRSGPRPATSNTHELQCPSTKRAVTFMLLSCNERIVDKCLQWEENYHGLPRSLLNVE
jgi:hypothetical protein